MISAKIKYKDGCYDIYPEQDLEGWTKFVKSVGDFYSSKKSNMPKVIIHSADPIEAKVETETDDHFVVNNIPSFGSDLKRFYGLTDDINECGYILPDGSCLDFSGRHLKYGLVKWDYVKGTKGITHDTVLGINNDGYCLTEHYKDLLWSSFSFSYAIMIYARAIRVGIGLADVEPFINVTCRLTQAQIDTLVEKCKGQKLIVDCLDLQVMPMFDQELIVSEENLIALNERLPNRS